MSGFKKILLITAEFPPGPGGIGNHAYNLGKFLGKNGHDVKVLAVSDYASRDEEKNFDEKEEIEIQRFMRHESRLKTLYGRINKIRDTIAENNFDIIIFSGRFSLLTSLLIPKKQGTKFVAIAHGGDINPDSKLLKTAVNSAIRKMDLIIPVSRFSRSKLNVNIPENKIEVIPNGFDIELADEVNSAIRNSLNGTLNLVTVGTVWPRKGHHNVLKALPLVLKKFPELKYKIIGRLADTSKTKSYFENEQIKKHLIVYGSVSNAEMIQELGQSQIFIMLSETQSSGDFEGFGIAVIEANSLGLPAIGSRNSGLEDSINDGESGILVDPKNPEEVVRAVEKIVNDYERFSTNAKQWALKHHWSNIVTLYEKAFDKIN